MSTAMPSHGGDSIAWPGKTIGLTPKNSFEVVACLVVDATCFSAAASERGGG